VLTILLQHESQGNLHTPDAPRATSARAQTFRPKEFFMTRKKVAVPQSDATDNGRIEAFDLRADTNGIAEAVTPKKTGKAKSDGKKGAPAARERIDPKELRLAHDYVADLGAENAVLSIPVRRPDKAWFVRVHPDKALHLQTRVIELKEERETYMVKRSLWNSLIDKEANFVPRAFFPAINRQGLFFLWPIRLPDGKGNTDEWSKTAINAAQKAMKKWIRITAKIAIGKYETVLATAEFDEPKWPKLTLDEIVNLAFGDRYITSGDHPVLCQLRGEK
jgi:hypothetical protein